MASLLLGTPPMASQFFTNSTSLSFSKSQSLIQTPLTLSFRPNSISTSSSNPSLLRIRCGRGDRKTARGKRFNHSYGNARPKDKTKGRGPPRVYAPPGPRKKDTFEEEFEAMVFEEDNDDDDEEEESKGEDSLGEDN